MENAFVSIRTSCRICSSRRNLRSPLCFFLWPAGEVLWQSTQTQDAFGTSSECVGLANFKQLFADPLYLSSFSTTMIFCALVTVSGLVISFLLMACADRVTRGAKAYQTLLIWPYARSRLPSLRCCGRFCSIRASGW
ncbi:Glycerol-3-phosphate ABC transporter, permease protein UgpA [Candidatus Burkholderia pumila]|uniref:Glycerol-3-phosphate ABC transporter, permease protein UgpA n=1 Tax=Candidatus Burkholderia pumila TaxID=1090375 RepID=A0ABR5HN48_9BURK|nr:Glycerol-3-phosphate ABC transporter, permease protein UgpA [Candidatus Burkholderia pumila]